MCRVIVCVYLSLALIRRSDRNLPDCAQRLIAPDGARHPFDLNPLRKERLVQGIDNIDVTLSHRAAIESFEAARRQRFDWLPVMSASDIGG